MYRTGANYERELLGIFRQAGFVGIRAAKSSCPDLVVAKGGVVLAIECKYTRREDIYLKAGEIEHMKEFAATSGFPVFYAIKFGRQPWIILDPVAIEKPTVKLGWVQSTGTPLPAFLEKLVPNDIK